MKVKVLVLSLLIIGMCSLAYGEERGCTHKELQPEGGFVCVGEAKIYEPPEKPESQVMQKGMRDNWVLADSLELSHYVDAGGIYSIYFNNDTYSLEQYPLYPEYPLLNESKQAIARAPKWLRNDLYNVLSRISELYQPEWASAINDAEDPYIDEIAFSIAHLSPEYLSANSEGDLYGSSELLQENAEMIYSNAQYLDYVEVVDYGSSTTDENYYSTTRYWKVDAAGDTVQVEVPREIYYWYIVDPKITDEIPGYINPNIIENNTTHNNNFADPPVGFFWRNYLFNQADAGYPVLKDSLAGCKVVWDGTQNVNATMTHAMAIITRWINETMEFTSGNERPHQPVRIYKKHIGRCGEHADISAATSRSALIPCTSILAISGDHTWNEFWDESWVHWEPVNNSLDNPLVYENGWGWSFGSVFEIRSDGWLSSVTGTYSDGSATITIYALDSQGNPIDGAEVLLAVLCDPYIYIDNYGLTDNEGKFCFTVGEGRHYYARIDTDIGSSPPNPNQVYSVVSNTVNGQDYTYSLSVSGTMPSLGWTSIDVPEDDVDDYRLEVDFTVPSQIVSGLSLMDDLNSSTLYKKEETGGIDYVMTDELNFIWFLMNIQFECFNILLNADQGNFDFDVPVGSDWYCNYSNLLHLNNLQYVDGVARLYSYVPTSVDDHSVCGSSDMLLMNSPNPFNGSTTISYFGTTRLHSASPWQANSHELSRIKIYNVKGQLVKQLRFNPPTEGSDLGFSTVWDGKDHSGKKVSPGIYFYKMCADGVDKEFNKLLLIR